MGKWGKRIKKKCKHCGKSFEMRPGRASEKGRGQFCSRGCSVQYKVGRNHPNWKEKIKQKCVACQKSFFVYPYEEGRKFCSHKCYWKSAQGKGHWRWKGGSIKNSKGYVLINCKNHPYCDRNGYVLEHRLVMEVHLGRVLLPTEVVHHINGIRDDNRIENLMLFSSNSEHTKYHRKERIKNG